MLYIRTFGGCSIERGGARLDELSGQRKVLSLLALLAGAGPRGLTRESVTALLWPDRDDERARTSLKQLVHSARRQLHPDLLLASADLRLDTRYVSSDVDDFRNAVRHGDHEGAVKLYSGPFLDGFHVRGADGFERWASDERTSLARDFAQALEALAVRADRSGDARTAVESWQRLATAEPLNERVAVGLLRALDASGDYAAAIQHARGFHDRVRDELGIEPDPVFAEALNELVRRRESGGRAQPADAPGTPQQGATLAVLPFANTGGDLSDEHFSDGLTDELIGTIGKLPGLIITGRTSSFSFKGKGLDVRAIAESLRVDHVLEGSVRRSGERLKIGAHLIRARDGAVIWSEIYDRDTKDVFAVQEEIAHAIANALRVRLGPTVSTQKRAATEDLVAHELYLKGRYFQNRVSEEDLRRSVAYFEQAITRDANYARAHAGLADAHLLLAVLGDGPQDYHVSQVREAVARALALDSTLAEAHTSLASILFSFDWNWPAAEREFERAIALDPGYGLAHQRYGLYLMYQGRFDEARPVLEQARKVDPLAPSASMNLGRLHLCAGRAEMAVPLLEAAVELNPRLALAHEHLGHAYLRLDRRDEAVAAFRVVAALGGARGATRLAYALAVTGLSHDARAILDGILRATDQDHLPSFGLAMAYAGLRDADTAFQWLERAYTERDAFLHSIKATIAFDVLHSSPRWAKLLRRLGLSP